MAKYKETYLLKSGGWREIVGKISKDFGLPKVSTSLGIYFDEGNSNFELKFIDSDCFFKANSKLLDLDTSLASLSDDTPIINIENRNIKFFLRALHSLGLSKAYMSRKVTNIKFQLDKVDSIDFNLNTPLGDLAIVRNKRANKYFHDNVIENKLESLDINEMFKKVIKPEPIFSNLNILNNKIVNYADEFGIDLNSSGQSSIESRLISKSNDYSDYEPIYEAIIGSSINSMKSKISKKFFKPISIIIPSFNSSKTLLEVLASIDSQDLNNNQKNLLDVIVIDDGSNISAKETIRDKSFHFQPNVVRLEKNGGLSNARNLGVSLAKYEHLLFIDSDILLAKNYLLEHSVALQMFPNSLFVSMKDNIEMSSKIREIKNIEKGLDVPKSFNDKRLIKTFIKDQAWVNEVKADGAYEVLSETDCFKLFGYKKVIGGYDLSSVVVGHNMSINKRLANKAGKFSEHFIGWGIEDSYFGSRVISSGGFIMPLLDTGVYHINHEPRSGSEKQKEKEYNQNIKIYKRLIEKEI